MTNLHQKLFYLLVLLLPTQLGFHFWPDWAFVFGIKVDYLAPTVYLTDLIIGGILIVWLLENKHNFQFSIFNFNKNSKFQIPNSVIFILIYLLFTSILVAQNQLAALYKLVKVIEFILLGFYVYKTKPLFIIRNSLFMVMIYTSLIALAQFFFQHTIGGPFYWLGERTFDVNTPGVALVNINGQDYLRPYATFPHPNALAGFLLAGLIWGVRGVGGKWGLVGWLLGLTALILTFSHSAWLAGLVVLLIYGSSYLRKRIVGLARVFLTAAILFSITLPILTSHPTLSTSNREISQRLELAKVSWQMFKDYPLTGAGLNNFVVRLPEYGQTPGISWFLQPVHNIFLLTLVETGLVGFVFLIWFLFKITQKFQISHQRRGPPKAANLKFKILLSAIILTGVVDHYWLTLQQNQLLLSMILGLCFSAKNHSLKNQL